MVAYAQDLLARLVQHQHTLVLMIDQSKVECHIGSVNDICPVAQAGGSSFLDGKRNEGGNRIL